MEYEDFFGEAPEPEKKLIQVVFEDEVMDNLETVMAAANKDPLLANALVRCYPDPRGFVN